MSGENNIKNLVNILACITLGSMAYTFYLSRDLESMRKKDISLEKSLNNNANKLDKQFTENKFKIYFSCDSVEKNNNASLKAVLSAALFW